MLQTTYLTVDKLKEYTPISSNVDVSLLENWIPVTEDMHIIPILGIALDTYLKTELEATGTLSGDNATLLIHIDNASAWYTYFEALGFLRTKTNTKGVTQQFSENSQVAPIEDYRALKQDILDKAMYFRNKLITFLDTNHSNYPLYRSQNDCLNNLKDYGSGIYV